MCKFNLKIKMVLCSILSKTLSVLLLLMASYQTAYANDEDAGYIEYVYPLKISLDAETLEGFVLYKLCPKDTVTNKRVCKKRRLFITPQTKAYADHAQVPLLQAKNRIGKYAAIVFDADTLVIKAISW